MHAIHFYLFHCLNSEKRSNHILIEHHDLETLFNSKHSKGKLSDLNIFLLCNWPKCLIICSQDGKQDFETFAAIKHFNFDD